jgi:hypothetical protein
MKFLYTITATIFFSIYSFGQTPHHCGTDYILQKALKENPSIQQNIDAIETYTAKYASENQHTDKALLITIPVVVHIVYNSAAENLSDARIQSQIAVLNQDFRRLNADASNTPAAFAGLAIDAEIEFCLATKDPSGNTTTGITRTSTSVTSFDINSDNIKFTSQGGKDAWPSNKYLNIWVGDITGGILGYATPPGVFPANQDGVVIGYQYFGTAGASAPYNKGRTTTHEVGHWLNLKHIWGDESGCTGTDNVTDTPNQAGENYSCPSFPKTDACSPSSPGVMFMNYMDYVDDNCMNMFTAGQKTRMHATINGTRASLFTSTGCSGSGGGGGGGNSSCDTLSNWTSGDQAVLYTVPNNGGYIGGHNTYQDISKAERFTNVGTNKQVTKVMYLFGVAGGYNASSKISATVWNESGGFPSAELGTKDVLVSSFAADVTNQAYTIVTFNTPIAVSNTFYAGIELYYAPSTIAVSLYSSTDGNQTPPTAFEQFQNGTWYRVDNTNSWQLDISWAVFPIVCDLTLGTESVAGLEQLKIYPNPTDGVVHVLFPDVNTSAIRVFDMMGRVIKNSSITPNESFTYSIDLSGEPNGIYFIEATQRGKTITQKVVLSK